MNRDKVIRNTLLKSIDPNLYFEQDFFTADAKRRKRECDIVTTKPSTIILSRQSYLNSPESQKQFQQLRKLEQSPRSPNQHKKQNKKFLTLVSRSKSVNTLKASKQKYRKLGCSRRSQRRLNSKLEYVSYQQNLSGRINRTYSCKAIGSKNSIYKSNTMTPQTSRPKLNLQKQSTPIHINDYQTISYNPQLKNLISKQQKPILAYNNILSNQMNPHLNQQFFYKPLIKSQSTQIFQKVYPSPRISFQYNNKTINPNQFYAQNLTTRTISTPINMITPTNKSQIRHSFIKNFQKIQLPNNIVNSQNNGYAYPIYPVYQIIESRQIVTPKKHNTIEQTQKNAQQLMHLSREIVESNEKRRKAFDLIQKKLDQLGSRTNSLTKFNHPDANNQELLIPENNKSNNNTNSDCLNEINKSFNIDNKKIIDRLDALIGKQNEKLSTGRNTPKQADQLGV